MEKPTTCIMRTVSSGNPVAREMLPERGVNTAGTPGRVVATPVKAIICVNPQRPLVTRVRDQEMRYMTLSSFFYYHIY